MTSTGGSFVYNGNPHGGAGSATGGKGESLVATLSYTGTGATTYGPSATAPTNAGTYQVVAHTAGDGNNNAGDSAPAALTITKANPVAASTGRRICLQRQPTRGQRFGNRWWRRRAWP